MGYTIFRFDELEWDEPSGGDLRRGIVRLSEAMRQMRANVWRLPPGSRGRRHAERVQEETFVTLEGDEARPERDARPSGNGSGTDVGQRQERGPRPEEQHPDPARLPGEELEEHGDAEPERQDAPEMLTVEPNRLGNQLADGSLAWRERRR